MEGIKPRMSKPFFLGSILGLIGVDACLVIAAGLFGFFQAANQSPSSDEGPIVVAAVSLLIILGLSFIYEIVVTCLLVHKMWSAIQDGQARTTPGKAVGFLFIPFYSLYWVFVAFRGFAQDYNALLERHQLALPRLPIGLFTAFAVLSVITAIPYLGCLTLLPLFVVFPMLVWKTCDAVNALPEIHPKPPEAMTREELEQAAQQRKPAGTPGWVWAVVAGCGGFTFLMIIGIIAAIAIPSLLVSKGKAQVQRTMVDMRSLSAAMEGYSVEHGRYPAASSAEEIAAILEKENFGTNLPRLDAWGQHFIIEVAPDGGRYVIISMGQNGVRETREPYPEQPRVNPEPGADIVFADGVFVSRPAGADR